jgi:hypothetical protein
MEAEHNRQEKYASQKAMSDKEVALKQELELRALVHTLIHNTDASVGNGVGGGGADSEEGGALSAKRSDEQTPTSISLECNGLDSDMAKEECQIANNDTHVNVAKWLRHVEHNSWLSGLLDVVFSLLLGSEYVHSSVPVIDLLMYSVGLCFFLFFVLFLFIISFSLFVLFK